MNNSFNPYAIKVLRVIDGDTLDVEFNLGFKIYTIQRVRLHGIDTPELRSKDSKEKKRAQQAKLYVQDFVENAKCLKAEIFKQGKFGRYLVELWDGGNSLNDGLINIGLAKEYFGGKR